MHRPTSVLLSHMALANRTAALPAFHASTYSLLMLCSLRPAYGVSEPASKEISHSLLTPTCLADFLVMALASSVHHHQSSSAVHSHFYIDACHSLCLFSYGLSESGHQQLSPDVYYHSYPDSSHLSSLLSSYDVSERETRLPAPLDVYVSAHASDWRCLFWFYGVSKLGL